MSAAHDPPVREGRRGDALRGLDWVIIAGPISDDFALRIASLCFLGPAIAHGAGAACYRRRPEIARRTLRRTLVIQRHGMGEGVPAEGTAPGDTSCLKGVTSRDGR